MIADAAGRELRRERGHLPRGGDGVVGVDQQHCVAGERLGEIDEGLHFVVVCLHERMRHRAEHRDAEARPRIRGGRAGEAGDVRGTRGQRTRLGTVRAAQAEVDQPVALRGEHRARRLGGDYGLEVGEVQDPRLEPLCLRDRSDHAQDRLVAEEHRALGHRPHLALEAQLAQPVGETCREQAAARHPLELLVGEARLLDEVEHLLQPGRDEERALGGQLAHEEFEGGDAVHAVLPVRLQHRQLVEVGQQG